MAHDTRMTMDVCASYRHLFDGYSCLAKTRFADGRAYVSNKAAGILCLVRPRSPNGLLGALLKFIHQCD